MGKLFLADGGFGAHLATLKSWLPKKPKVALILNGADYRGEEGRKIRAKEELASLEAAGFRDVKEVDLKTYENGEKLYNELKKFNLVWVRGGNAFYLRWIMRESGFDSAIARLLSEDKIVYGGYSAGACVMSLGLWCLGEMDDESHAPEVIYEGLGYVDRVIVPHFDSKERQDVARSSVDKLKQKNIEPITLNDNQVILVEDDKWRILT